MKHGNISFDKIDEFLKLYKETPLIELQKIEPKWAYGKYIKKLYDYDLDPQKKEFTFFLADPTAIIANAEFGEINPHVLFTGDSKNDFRITRLLYRWENNYFVDPPTIGLCSLNNKMLQFSDGRHRTKLSFYLSFDKIPIAIANYDIQKVNTIIQLTQIT
jgi:hypothetical protein